MTAYRTPWTLSVDGNGVYIHDADRNLIRAIENDEGEDQIALWSRIVDAVNARDDLVAHLQCAIDHIDHMAAWIGKQRAGYSFESLGEDMPAIRAALSRAKAQGGA